MIMASPFEQQLDPDYVHTDFATGDTMSNHLLDAGYPGQYDEEDQDPKPDYEALFFRFAKLLEERGHGRLAKQMYEMEQDAVAALQKTGVKYGKK
jgi:hypothetical protein